MSRRELTVKYVLDRLKEPSTWQGLAAVLAVVGVQFTPESQDVVVEMFKDIGALFGSVTAAILVFWKRDSQSGTGDGRRR